MLPKSLKHSFVGPLSIAIATGFLVASVPAQAESFPKWLEKMEKAGKVITLVDVVANKLGLWPWMESKYQSYQSWRCRRDKKTEEYTKEYQQMCGQRRPPWGQPPYSPF
jgi:hypothetical protein